MTDDARPETRTAAAAQIALVVGGTYGLIALVQKIGLGLGGGATRDLLVHVLIIGGGSLVLIALALARTPRRLHVLGLGPKRLLVVFGGGLLGAFVTYVANAMAVAIYLAATGGLKNEVAAADQKAKALAVFVTVPLWQILPLAMFVGFYEEVVFRGFLLGRLHVLFGSERARMRTAVLAVAVSSAMFALGHAYQGAVGVIQTFVAGACLATLVLFTRSLWPSIVAHAAIDTFGLIAVRFLVPVAQKAIDQLQNAPR
jgi:membrane protease YdiL (CAAX protease family)